MFLFSNFQRDFNSRSAAMFFRVGSIFNLHSKDSSSLLHFKLTKRSLSLSTIEFSSIFLIHFSES